MNKQAVSDTTSWDAIIIGQGLAGTALGWRMHLAGARILIIDPQEEVTCSRIAAGLITPITGKRLVLSQRCIEALPEARRFYREIERLTGTSFFHERTTIRLFNTDKERTIWQKRLAQPHIQEHLCQPQPAPLLPDHLADSTGGGFAMKAAQLDTTAYLDASRRILPFKAACIDWRKDVSFTDDHVIVAGECAHFLISCEGFAASHNPFFSNIGFRAAKGEILTVKFTGPPVPPITLHRGIWAAPTQEENIFRTGSTYDWDTLDQTPTMDAREKITNKLKALIHPSFEVIDHKAAVRPIINESRAMIGLHPHRNQLGYFNGLGSKGSLYSPLYARHFTSHLLHGAPLPEEMDLRCRENGNLSCV